MSKILTVFGASGNQGGSVVRTVLADPQLSKEFKIRAITRDESKASIKEFAEKGVEIVKVRRMIVVRSKTRTIADPLAPNRQICPPRMPPSQQSKAHTQCSS